MLDTHKHKGLRKKLVKLLEEKGITDTNVLNAIGNVPRHLFISDSIFQQKAYEDIAFPIGDGQTISQPFTVAYQSQLLSLERGQTVLEIGTGSGYQAAVLAALGVKVFSIERHKSLHQKSKKVLMSLGYNRLRTFFGDGFMGLPAFAPFDRIIITAAAPSIPEQLLGQLKVGGYMVIPHGEGNAQQMKRIEKVDDETFREEHFGEFFFVPMLDGKVF